MESISTAIEVVEDITGQKRVEQIESHLASIVESSDDAIISKTLDGVITSWNAGAERIYGYSADEVMGRPVSILVHQDEVDEVSLLLDKVGHGLSVAHYETMRIRKDGERIYVSLSISAIKDKNGSIVEVSTIARDITERKRAEEELQRANAYNRRLIEASLDPLVTIGPDVKIADVNAATEEVTGCRREGLIGSDFCDYFTDPEAARSGYRKVFREGLVRDYPLEIRHRDGHTTPVLYNASVFKDDGGNVIGVFAAARDITKKKRAEEDLRWANTYNRRLIEASLDPLVTIGPEGWITDANSATEEVTGCCWDELIGSDFCDYFTDPEAARSGYRKVFREGLVRDYPLEIRHRDGHTTPVLYNASVFKDEGGNVIGVFAAARDITEHRKLEAQLRQAQKMESIGVLAGGVAHDFNNLLTAISGYGQILLETTPEDDELSLDNIRNVLKAADRAAELTRGLLAFSRKQTINPKPVHIDSLIGNASKLIQRIIGEDIEFGTNFLDKNLLVKTDAGQIEQVLMNLATNSRDAMPDGGHLCVTARKVVVEDGSEKLFDLLSPGKYALISVSDTGIGIEKESLGKVFEPFYTTKGVGEGTGLGLSMVHGIIKQHNGSVLVDSEPGKGTTFNIYLPLIEGHAEVEKSKRAASPAAGMETVLVVEDEEILRVFMQKMLEMAGYRVILADNGEDGVERFRENDDISLVLSDMVMPRKNGMQMLNEIRRMKPGTKAVFMSGYTADIMQDKGMLDDVTEFIAKPVKNDDLLRKVRELLDKD
jgi:PAS domain S-box-containing protein